VVGVGSPALGGSATTTFHAIAIGDSLPYGRGDCGGCPTFIELFGKAMARATGTQVAVRNLSEHTGIDSRFLRHELATSPTLRSTVAGADAITVTIGHNDTPWNSDTDACDGASFNNPGWSSYKGVCLSRNVARYGANLDSILKQIRALRHGRPTLIRVTDDYDDLIGDPSVPKSAYAAAKRVVDAYAARTCTAARAYQAVCIDTYHAFNGPTGTRAADALLAKDHTHPNARGHRLIAALLARAGFLPLHR
jgi:lysophospholipase L1-like esterase